jgi:SAM-dependent methyltransferase
MSNAKEEQQAYWNGAGGERWTEHQESLDRMVRPFGLAALARLALVNGEKVLDVGCGCGDTLLAIAERVGPTGHVTGIDLSERMLERAGERVPGATLIAGDASEHAFRDAPFDAIYSRFGVMFFADAALAFRRLRGLSSDAGRIAFVCWRAIADNPWASVPFAAVRAALPEVALGPQDRADGPGPFSLADADATSRLLRDAGFHAIDVLPFDCEVELSNSGLDDAVRFTLTASRAAHLLTNASESERARAALFVKEALSSYQHGERVALAGAAWTVLASASAVSAHR